MHAYILKKLYVGTNIFFATFLIIYSPYREQSKFKNS